MSTGSVAAEIVAMRDTVPQPSFTEIGEHFGMSRQRANALYRQAKSGRPTQDRVGRIVEKDDDAVHMADVRVDATVHAAAVARLDSMEPSPHTPRRIPLAEVCRRIIGQDLDPESFPQLRPYRGTPPGSAPANTQVVRFRTVWGWYAGRRDHIHARGYSLTEVVERGLKAFARTGVMPPEPTDVHDDSEGTTK